MGVDVCLDDPALLYDAKSEIQLPSPEFQVQISMDPTESKLLYIDKLHGGPRASFDCDSSHNEWGVKWTKYHVWARAGIVAMPCLRAG